MDQILRYFETDHLPASLRAVSEPFRELAHLMAAHLPNGPEKSVCLRKLLEGKDAAVRAALPGLDRVSDEAERLPTAGTSTLPPDGGPNAVVMPAGTQPF